MAIGDPKELYLAMAEEFMKGIEVAARSLRTKVKSERARLNKKNKGKNKKVSGPGR
jgi:hypothetical protein